MDIVPAALHPRDRYKLMISVIVPRPIAWVSTMDAQGRHNLAPFSFFTGITASPMTVCFAPANDREGRKKDTLLNVEETKEFVINAAVEELAEKMVETSAVLPRGVSEFERAGLTPLASTDVKPPRVKESPLSMECRLKQVVTVSTGPLGGNLVIGEVVRIHAADSLLVNGAVDVERLKPVARLGGLTYARLRDFFEIRRPD